jgi:hypothetical protein
MEENTACNWARKNWYIRKWNEKKIWDIDRKLNTLSKTQIDEPKQIHKFHPWVVNKTNITVLNEQLYLKKGLKYSI